MLKLCGNLVMLECLILENYIPLLSSGIHRVELNPVQMVNLFVATNGTGKTSILKECNPCPPENGNYKEGRKYSRWKVKNKTYVLDSYTGIGNGHSFKVDGKELNTGGTFTVQKDLCDSHFGIDPNTCRVLSGIRIADRFSAMSANRRKEIFMDVYPNDTQYALGVYNKLRTERNELKAAIKNQVSRYADEKNKLSFINEVGVEQLEQNIRDLEAKLKEALLVRGSLEGANRDPFLADKIAEFNNLTDRLTVNTLSGFIYTATELAEQLDTQRLMESLYQNQAATIQGMIAENAAGLEGLEEFLKDPEAFEQQNKIITSDLERTQAEIDSINSVLSSHQTFSDKEIDLKGLDVVVSSFGEYLRRVIPSSDPELTSSVYRQLLTDYDVTLATIKERKLKLTDYTHKLKHYESAESVECPDCKSQFKVGVTKQDIESLRAQISALQVGLTKLEEKEKGLKKRIENDSEWFNSMNSLFMFIRENSHVRILPELIKEYNVGREYSETLQNVLNLFARRCKMETHKTALLEEKRLLDARAEVLNRNSIYDAAAYVASLEEELHSENEKIRKTRERIKRLTGQLTEINNYNNDLRKLELLKTQIFRGLEDGAKVQLRTVVDNQVHAISADKDEALSAIIKSRSLTAVVQSIEDDINRMKRRLLIVETYMDGLCPNKGLIGRLMSDFIATVCGNINYVLSQIWDKPLYIKPCNKSNGDLTYKFPVSKGLTDPAPDIADCSAGEIDIIDWAFRFVLLNYKDFPFPLIMDEVGPFLDDIKRGRFFNFVKNYTEEKDARQLLLVSHYLGERNMFKDANFVGLRYEGLSLPGKMNENTLVV